MDAIVQRAPKPEGYALARRIALVLLLWAAARWLFFEGITQGDDQIHIRFAALWDRVPADPLEARLLYNGMMRAAFALFGVNAFSANLPNLFGSLLILGSGMWIAWYAWRDTTAVFLCGLLLALTPMDVRLSTAARAYACPVGFLTLGCAALLTGTRPRSALWAGLAFAVAISLHEINLIFAGVFPIALWLSRQRNLRDCSLCALATAAAFLLIETLLFLPWTGDAFYRFHLLLAQSSWHPARGLDLGFFTWPVSSLVLSKYLGILMPIGILGVFLRWRSATTLVRAALLGTLFFWAAITYGAQLSGFSMLWRMDRYWNPLLVLVVITVVDTLVHIASQRRRNLLLAAILAVNFGILASKGSSGFEPRVSEELLGYARAHPDVVFVTDDYTLDDMFLINGCAAPANVFALPPAAHTRLFQARALERVRTDIDGVCALVNPMNLKNGPRESSWLASVPGTELYASPARYRALSYMLPESVRRESAELLVKPPGRVVEIRVAAGERPQWWR